MRPIKVVSLNTKLLSLVMHYDDTSTWPWQDPERVRILAEYLFESDFDVICLQEVWSEVLRGMLRRRLEKEGYLTIPKVGGPWYKLYTEDSGLFFASKFPVISSTFNLFEKSSGADAWSDKGVQQVVLGTPSGPVRIYNTHMNADPNGSKARASQLRQIRSIVDSLGYSIPTFLVGDLNVPYGSAEATNLSSILGGEDVLEAIGQGNEPTFNPLENPSMMCRADKGTPSVRLDYLINFNAEIRNARIDKFALPHGKHEYLSDHYGIRAVVVL